MLEVKRAELDAAYDAVEALLDVADVQTFPFQIGIVDEARWTLLNESSDRNPVTRGLGVERFELARCSADVARGVLRRVVEIAKMPIFNNRCRNQNEDAAGIDGSASQLVIYLMKCSEIITSAGPEEPTMPGVPRAMSGMRLKARSVKSA